MLLYVVAFAMMSTELEQDTAGLLTLVALAFMIVASVLVIIFESKFLKAMNALNEHYNSHEKTAPVQYY